MYGGRCTPYETDWDTSMRCHQLQFTVHGLSIAVAVFAVVTAVLIRLSPVAVWVGYASIPLEFVILDAPTGQPLEGALVRLAEYTPEYNAVTTADGRAKFDIHAMITGRSSLIQGTRTVNYAWTLSVACDGHQGISQDLREVTREPGYHSGPAPPPIVVRLARCH